LLRRWALCPHQAQQAGYAVQGSVELDLPPSGTRAFAAECGIVLLFMA